MYEKFWSCIENADRPNITAEILARTYTNPKSAVLKDILPFFNEWIIEDFEKIVDEVLIMPPLEGERIHTDKFGEVGIAPYLDFNEGYNLAVLPEAVWEHAGLIKALDKKKFF